MKRFLAGPIAAGQGRNLANRLYKRCEVGLPGAGSWMIPVPGIFFLVLMMITLPMIHTIAAQGAGISVTKTNDLQFGTLLTGAPYAVLPTDADAAGFEIRWPGRPGRQVDVNFSLPAQLYGAGSMLPISFGPNALEWDYNQDGNNRQPANPNFPLRLTTEGGGRLYLWLGANVDVPISTRNGTYSNVIVVTVSQVFN